MRSFDYLLAVRDKLSASGFQTDTLVDNRIALLGFRSDFRWEWFASTLHTFVCLREVSLVTPSEMSLLVEESLNYGVESKGRYRGLQSGIAVISVLVGNHVEEAAAQYAATVIAKRFGAFSWPVAVDLTTGERFSHVGSPVLGRPFTKWMREVIDDCVPAPSLEPGEHPPFPGM